MSSTNNFGKVTEGFAVSTKNVRGINKDNMTAVMTDTGSNFGAATAPNPGLVKVMETKGLGNKMNVMAENLKEGMRENQELDRRYREGVQSHESYRELLEEQRASRQATINGTKYGRGKYKNAAIENTVIVTSLPTLVEEADYVTDF